MSQINPADAVREALERLERDGDEHGAAAIIRQHIAALEADKAAMFLRAKEWAFKCGQAEAKADRLAALAGAAPDHPAGEMDRSAPERVWLQIDTDGDPEDRSEVIRRENWSDLTWCYESIGGQEVVYIRADLAHAPAKAREDDVRDARRYRWLRARHWNESELFVVAGHHSTLRLGTYCPSEDRLDAAIDAGMTIESPAIEFSNPGDSEAQFIADGERLNCPSCGGSGHVGDTPNGASR